MLLLNACCSLLPVACWCGRADGAVGQAVTRPRARLRAARGGGLSACFCNPQLLRFRGRRARRRRWHIWADGTVRDRETHSMRVLDSPK